MEQTQHHFLHAVILILIVFIIYKLFVFDEYLVNNSEQPAFFGDSPDLQRAYDDQRINEDANAIYTYPSGTSLKGGLQCPVTCPKVGGCLGAQKPATNSEHFLGMKHKGENLSFMHRGKSSENFLGLKGLHKKKEYLPLSQLLGPSYTAEYLEDGSGAGLPLQSLLGPSYSSEYLKNSGDGLGLDQLVGPQFS
jgi:hypothetical protein